MIPSNRSPPDYPMKHRGTAAIRPGRAWHCPPQCCSEQTRRHATVGNERYNAQNSAGHQQGYRSRPPVPVHVAKFEASYAHPCADCTRHSDSLFYLNSAIMTLNMPHTPLMPPMPQAPPRITPCPTSAYASSRQLLSTPNSSILMGPLPGSNAAPFSLWEPRYK